ncbi:hypothetical protein RhiirA4_390480 [Rhizophagus irregularis]|uniref:Uncharacterized protein n=1 Tax=Rhizophagus irregularis TaxID=588596 RepID=A0A2I1FSX3_9GLOM|nr:hypothetical protein RhiirA4_390480 [Rhizophagus irregularis]
MDKIQYIKTYSADTISKFTTQFGDPEEQNEDNSFNLDTIQVSGNHRGGFLG